MPPDRIPYTHASPINPARLIAWIDRESDIIAQVYRMESQRGDRDEIGCHHLIGAGAILQKLAKAITSGDLDADAAPDGNHDPE